MKTIHIYSRADIMRRAHQIARAAREEIATAAYAADQKVECGRIVHTKSFKAFLAATPVDFSAAMKQAWAEAKGANGAPGGGALVVSHTALAPIGANPAARLWPLLLTAARFVHANVVLRSA